MAPQCTSSMITLSDGRVLGYEISAAADLPATAPTVLYFHGTPGSTPEGGLLKSQGIKNSVRFVTLERPGYGNSTSQPSRTLLDWPKDVLEFVDQIKVNKFYVLGLSGGAAYVWACLKCIPQERLLGAATVSGAFPGCLKGETIFTNRVIVWIGHSWFSPILPYAIDLFGGRAARDTSQAAKFEKSFVKEMASRHPREAQCLEDADVRKAAIESCRHSFKQGSHAMADEMTLISGEWNIPPDDLDGTRLHVWYGRQDKNVSCEAGVEVAKSITGSKIHVLEDEAHLSLIVNYSEDILSQLLEITQH